MDECLTADINFEPMLSGQTALRTLVKGEGEEIKGGEKPGVEYCAGKRVAEQKTGNQNTGS